MRLENIKDMIGACLVNHTVHRHIRFRDDRDAAPATKQRPYRTAFGDFIN